MSVTRDREPVDVDHCEFKIVVTRYIVHDDRCLTWIHPQDHRQDHPRKRLARPRDWRKVKA